MKRMQDGQSCEAAVGPTLQEGFATSSRVVHEVGEMLTERHLRMYIHPFVNDPQL